MGHGGPFPSPAEEQDVVLELGNLWYNRYCLLSDEQGVSFLADEALDEALRFYGESRELCVDLVAESGENGGAGRQAGEISEVSGEDGGPAVEAAGREAAAAAAAGCLLRAEFNVGMSLFEKEKLAEAEPHLADAVRIFRELFLGTTTASESGRAAVREAGEGGRGSVVTVRGGRDREVGVRAMAAWKAAVQAQEELAGLGGVFASSLSLLGSCLLAPSPCPSSAAAPAEGRENETLHRRALETLEASVEAFLEIDDHGRALDPLLKLVEALRLLPDGTSEVDQRLPETEALFRRVSCGLSAADEEPDADEDLELERGQLEEVREGIADLRARGARDGSSVRRSESGTRAAESSAREQRQQGQRGDELGDTARVAGMRVSSSPSPKFRRVGPLPTAGFAQRRAAAAAAAAARNTAGAVARTTSSSSAAMVSSRNRYQVSGAAAGRGGRGSGVGGGRDAGGLASDGGGGGDGSVGNGHLGRGGEGGSSFAGLRAAVALEDGMAVVTAASPRSEGRRDPEPGLPARESLFDSYTAKVGWKYRPIERKRRGRRREGKHTPRPARDRNMLFLSSSGFFLSLFLYPTFALCFFLFQRLIHAAASRWSSVRLQAHLTGSLSVFSLSRIMS